MFEAGFKGTYKEHTTSIGYGQLSLNMRQTETLSIAGTQLTHD
jgi:hypothetical protein